MNRIYCLLCFLFGFFVIIITAKGQNAFFNKDIEVKIPGLVCQSCAIGIKNVRIVQTTRYTLSVLDVIHLGTTCLNAIWPLVIDPEEFPAFLCTLFRHVSFWVGWA